MSTQKNQIVDLLEYAKKLKSKDNQKNFISLPDYEEIAKDFLLATNHMIDPEFATMYAFCIKTDFNLSDLIQEEHFTIASGYEVVVLAKSKDIYEMIASKGARRAARYFPYVAFSTYGWSAAIDSDTDIEDEILPPSQRPDRRRVKMVIFSSSFQQQLTAISFRDENDEYILDDYIFDSTGTGSLADAVRELYT